jgi:hypothetical protein
MRLASTVRCRLADLVDLPFELGKTGRPFTLASCVKIQADFAQPS